MKREKIHKAGVNVEAITMQRKLQEVGDRADRVIGRTTGMIEVWAEETKKEIQSFYTVGYQDGYNAGLREAEKQRLVIIGD